MFKHILLRVALVGAIGVIGLNVADNARAQTWQWQSTPYTTYYSYSQPSPYYYSPYTPYYGSYPTYYGGGYTYYQAPVYQPNYSYYPSYYSVPQRVVTVPY
jgi:hypothetical protein